MQVMVNTSILVLHKSIVQKLGIGSILKVANYQENRVWAYILKGKDLIKKIRRALLPTLSSPPATGSLPLGRTASAPQRTSLKSRSFPPCSCRAAGPASQPPLGTRVNTKYRLNHPEQVRLHLSHRFLNEHTSHHLPGSPLLWDVFNLFHNQSEVSRAY